MVNDTLASRGVLTFNDPILTPASTAQPSLTTPSPTSQEPQNSQAGRASNQAGLQSRGNPRSQQSQEGHSQLPVNRAPGLPTMAHTQLRVQSQPRVVPQQGDFDLSQHTRINQSPKRYVEISDLRTEQMTELEARDFLTEFAIFRFEKVKNDAGLDVDNFASKPSWQIAKKTEVLDLSKEDATRFVYQLDRAGKPVAEEKASLPSALQRQVEKAHVALANEESEPEVFQWVLAQLHSKKRRLDKNSSGEYFVSKNYRDEIRLFSARPSFSRERKSRYKKERVSLTVFFKRVVRPEISALDVLEQRRRIALMRQRQAARAAMAVPQFQQGRVNELQRARQASAARQLPQIEAQQQMRTIEAANQQQQAAQAFQQRPPPPPVGPGVQQQIPQVQGPGMQQGVQQGMPQNVNRVLPRAPGQTTGQMQGVPPTVPMPPQNNVQPGGPQQQQQQQKQQQQPQQPQRRPSTGSQPQQGRNQTYNNGQTSPRSSQYSIDSDDFSGCDTVDTPVSSVSNESQPSRRDGQRSRSRSRGRGRGHYHRHCRDCPEEYGFEPVRRFSRSDQHYILEKPHTSRLVRGRDSPPAEPIISFREIDSLRREAYDAGFADRRAMARGIEERPVDDLVFRPRATLPPRVLQRRPSVRLIHPQRLEDEIEFERLRLDDEYEQRRSDVEFERRRWQEDLDRRRYEEAMQASMAEEDMRRRRAMESQVRRPLEEEAMMMREERAAEEYMRARERSPVEFENPFGPFERGRRHTMYSQR